MKATLTKVIRYTEGKDGQPLKTKDGRPYTRLVIKTNEHGDKTISGFENTETQNWKEGSEVEVEITENGEYLNFRVPKKEDKLSSELSEIKTKLGKMNFDIQTIIRHLSGENPLNLTSAGTKVPDFSEVDDIPPEDAPFP